MLRPWALATVSTLHAAIAAGSVGSLVLHAGLSGPELEQILRGRPRRGDRGLGEPQEPRRSHRSSQCPHQCLLLGRDIEPGGPRSTIRG